VSLCTIDKILGSAFFSLISGIAIGTSASDTAAKNCLGFSTSGEASAITYFASSARVERAFFYFFCDLSVGAAVELVADVSFAEAPIFGIFFSYAGVNLTLLTSYDSSSISLIGIFEYSLTVKSKTSKPGEYFLN
jgi:hypothetical protein